MSRIPEGWNIMKVKEIAQKNRSAMSTGPFGSSISAKYFVDEGIPVIRGGNLSNKHEIRFVDRNFVFISRDKAKEFERSAVYQHDLIFTCWGTINQVGLIPNDSKYPFYIISNKQMKLTVDKSKFSSEYIYNLFSSGPIQKQIKRRSIGSSVPGFNLIQLKQIKLLIPTIQEQSKIAKILATWDKAINTTQALIDVNKQQKKALMQQLLTGKNRFPEFHEKWRNVYLPDIADIKKGKALNSKDIIHGQYPVIAGGKSSPYTHNKYTHENVITISASGANAGYISFHPYRLWASDCTVITNRNENSRNFIYQILLAKQTQIYSMQSGGAQPHIYPKDLASLKFFVPSLDEQQKIVLLLSAVDKEIKILQQKLACLAQEKKALMQQLLTGKKRVKLEEKDTNE